MRDELTNLTGVLAHELLRVEPLRGAYEGALDDLNRALREASVREDCVVHTTHDYSALLDSALVAGSEYGTAAVSSALAAVRSPLPWIYHYAARPGEEDLAARIAFAELIGPDGPMSAANSRVGFTLIAPNTYYPMHAHPAVELYWVISGHAEWQTPTAKRTVPPGDFVLHGSNELHAMRTLAEPLLALWGWSGDIDTPAFYV